MCAVESSTPLLAMRGISKAFAGVQALRRRGFYRARRRSARAHGRKRRRQKHAAEGADRRLPARLRHRPFDGQPFHPAPPATPRTLGVSTVYQEVNLVPQLSVAENICLGRQPERLGLHPLAAMNAACAGGACPARPRPRRRPPAQLLLHRDPADGRHRARAGRLAAKLLVLDEPTSSLDADEVGSSSRHAQAARARAWASSSSRTSSTRCTSHRRITVLRNGSWWRVSHRPSCRACNSWPHAGQGSRRTCSSRDATGRPAARRTDRRPRVSGASRRGRAAAADLSIRAGEVVGLAGLLGSGRTETARMLFGVDAPDRGTLALNGDGRHASSPRQAIRTASGSAPRTAKRKASSRSFPSART